MKKLKYRLDYFSVCGVALVSGLLQTSSALWAGEVVEVVAMSFGEVEINPASCEVTLDAKNGAVKAMPTRTVVVGGDSGKITIRSAVEEQVHIEYNDSAFLWSAEEKIGISDVQSLSQYHNQYINLEGSNIPVDIHIGGRLVLTGDESIGNYSGKMEIVLTFTVL